MLKSTGPFVEISLDKFAATEIVTWYMDLLPNLDCTDCSFTYFSYDLNGDIREEGYSPCDRCQDNANTLSDMPLALLRFLHSLMKAYEYLNDSEGD